MQHAKAVLRETDAIEALAPRRTVANRLRVSTPRSASILKLTAQYLNTLPLGVPLDAAIRECHARMAIEMLAGGETEIGLIRFRSDYQDYFEDQTAARSLVFEPLRKLRYLVTLSRNHPLARAKSLLRSDLEGLPEIAHGDAQRVAGRSEQSVIRKIYCVDRLAQMTLLETIPNSYMLSAAMPEEVLTSQRIVQIPYEDNPFVYHDALVYHKQYAMSEIEQGYVQFLRDHLEEI